MAGNYLRKDHFYNKAKSQGYRSRAAYKLIELDKKHKLFKSGARVLDLGSFPGSWLQVALERVGQTGRLLGVDLRELEPLQGSSIELLKVFIGDAADEDLQAEILRQSDGGFNLIMSDMSPKLSGIKFRDAVLSAELVSLAHNISRKMLKKDGALVAKIFPGSEVEEVLKSLRESFLKINRHSLKATRGSSNEFYIVAKGFLG